MKTNRLLTNTQRIGIITAACALVFVTTSALPAGAAVRSATEVTTVTEMTVTGFDRATAIEDGYPPTPLGTVVGDCGTSFVTVALPGAHQYQVRTGFTVDEPAVSYDWAADTYGDTPRRDTWSGGLFFKYSWSAQGGLQKTAIAGRYDTIVTTPSQALLIDGTICTSGHPLQGFIITQ